MLRDWYSKKDEILQSHHKHKHSALDQILREKKVINDHVTDFSECSSYDSFEPESDPTIEDAVERLPNEIDNDESEDSDFELDSSESESDGES